MDLLILIINLAGTIAFAASGALVGLRKNMDLFGVCILGLTTAVGGGIIRDLVLGITPPMTFRDPIFAAVALATSGILFIRDIRHLLMRDTHRYNLLMLWMDSLGLGAFTVVGIQAAYQTVPHPTLFLLVFVGVITGVGGGVIRDLMAGDMPFILVRQVYATASLVGALVCAGLWPLGSVPAMLGGIAVVVLIRCLAAHFRWELPKAKD